jgi:leucyl-tRNA synthetase
VLHLLYSRFVTMALKDLGKISFEEPFTKFRAHGLIVKDGAKMSKSKGNVVIPDEYIRKFGADTLRTYLMFMGPFSQGGDFRDTGIEGMHRFVRRVWALLGKFQISNFKSQISNESLAIMHKTIKKVTEDVGKLNYNTAIASLMEWYNFLSQQRSISKGEIEVFLKLLAPFAPHVSEELYQLLNPPEARQGDKNEFSSIHVSTWPTFDPKFLVKEEIIIVVQVNGKLRGNIKVQKSSIRQAQDKVQSYVEDLAKKDPNVSKHLEGKNIKKTIYVEGKVINFVV